MVVPYAAVRPLEKVKGFSLHALREGKSAANLKLEKKDLEGTALPEIIGRLVSLILCQTQWPWGRPRRQNFHKGENRMFERRANELAKLRAAFPCGTIPQAKLAYTRATTLGATEAEIERVVGHGIDLMHRHRNNSVLVLRPAAAS